MLAAAKSSGSQKRFGILKVVVEVGTAGLVADGRGNDLALAEGRPVVYRDDADGIVGVLDYDRLETLPLRDHFGHLPEEAGLALRHADRVGSLGGEHDELCEVDRVRALAQYLALRPLLSAVGQKTADILEIVGPGIRSERLRRCESDPVTHEYVADLPLRDGDKRRGMHAGLKGNKKMIATTQTFASKPH